MCARISRTTTKSRTQKDEAQINYEKDIQIDPQALDVEWLRQPELMRKYTKHCADMKQEMDAMKEALAFGKAEIELDIRTNPDQYGLSKVTESGIQSTVLLQDKYQDMVKVYAQAQYEYEVAVGAVRAFDMKKSALENLVRLLAASYFAGPVTPRDLSKESLDQARRREANAKVRIGRTSDGGGQS